MPQIRPPSASTPPALDPYAPAAKDPRTPFTPSCATRLVLKPRAAAPRNPVHLSPALLSSLSSLLPRVNCCLQLDSYPTYPALSTNTHHHFTAQQDGQGRSCRCRRRHRSGENEVVELQDYSNRIQPLSLLLKQNQHVTELALYDVVNSPGVATDLSHISSPAVRANPHASHIHEQELTAGRKSQATCPRKMA